MYAVPPYTGKFDMNEGYLVMTTSLESDDKTIYVGGIDNIGKLVDIEFKPYAISKDKIEYSVGLNLEFNGSGYWSVAEINYKDGLPYDFNDMDSQPWKFLTNTEFQQLTG